MNQPRNRSVVGNYTDDLKDELCAVEQFILFMSVPENNNGNNSYLFCERWNSAPPREQLRKQRVLDFIVCFGWTKASQ